MGREELGWQQPVMVFVPFPARGHVTPMLHLAAAFHRLGFRPLVVLPDSIYRRLRPSDQKRGRLILHEDEECRGRGVLLASIPDGVGEDATGDLLAMERAMEEVMPEHLEGLLRRVVLGGGGRVVVACVVVDLLASWAMEVAVRCRVPVAGFWPAMLATYRVISASPDLVRHGLLSPSGIPIGEATISDDLPRCMPDLSTEDLPWLVGDLASQRARFAFWQRTLDRSRALRWLIANTFSDEDCLLGGTDAGHDHNHTSHLCMPPPPRVFPVGPLSWKAAARGGGHGDSCLSLWEEDGSCMRWLDSQPSGSVVYVSFGSWVAPIGDGSVAELALGLEAAGRPFLWVLGDSCRSGLPDGFQDRVAGRGKVVGWAPQREVLRHQAVGCFLTHCGWNSTMEAVECRRRLLCHPVAGDQFINCRYIVEVWGVGLRLGGLRQQAVEEGVGRVMGAEGEQLQRRVDEMSKEINGEAGREMATAELLAFVGQLEESTAVGGEWPLPHMSSL